MINYNSISDEWLNVVQDDHIDLDHHGRSIDRDCRMEFYHSMLLRTMIERVEGETLLYIIECIRTFNYDGEIEWNGSVSNSDIDNIREKLIEIITKKEQLYQQYV